MTLRPILLLASAALLAGCFSATRPEPVRLLLSYDGPAPMASAAAARTLVVRAVSVPDYLDRRPIVRRDGATLQEQPGAVWAERPGKAITRYLSQALAAQRPDYLVQPLTTASGTAPDAALSVVVDRFEPQGSGAVQLRGSFTVTAPGRVLGSGRFDADVPMAASDAAGQVRAMQQALEIASAGLAKALPTLAAEPR